MPTFSRMAAIAALFALGACSSVPVHEALPDAAKAKLSSTDVVLPIKQSEIYVFVPPSTGGAQAGASAGAIGALVGAIIDASVDKTRTSKAEAAVTPLRNAVVDYSFDEVMKKQIAISLTQDNWLHAGNISITHEVTDEDIGRTIAASKAPAVLFVFADYRLSNNGDVLWVTWDARLIPNDETLRALHSGKSDTKFAAAPENALYRNRFVFEARVQSAGDRDKNIAEWSANKGNAMRQALDTSLQKLAALLAQDMQRAENDGAAVSDHETTISDTAEIATCGAPRSAEAECGKTGAVVISDRDGQVVRFKDGSVKYIDTAALD